MTAKITKTLTTAVRTKMLPNSMMSSNRQKDIISASIEIRAEKVSQLFDTHDPSAYPQKDLPRATEEFIVGWARELPRSRPIEVVVHLPAAQADSVSAQQLGDD